MVEDTSQKMNADRTGRFSSGPRRRSFVNSCAHCVAHAVVLASVSFQSAVAFGTTAIEAQQDAANAESVANPEPDPIAETAADDVRTLQFVSAGSIAESDTFDTDLSNSDLLEAKDRAWQYRPYRVAVWICLDGSPELSVVSDRLKEELLAHAELIDPSGWDLAIDAAPRQWRWQLLENISNPDLIGGFQSEPILQDYDKLMVVALSCPDGTTRARVREYDMLTGQWGALVNRDLAQRDRLSACVMEMFRNAFMPLARIDRVTQKEGARLLPRALQACVVNKRVDLESYEAVENSQSPVFIRKEDRFLPVIRRTDRKGALKKLDPIEFTFLTVREANTLEIMCDVHSSQRGPLAQRKSKRAQKLALVIRAPEQPTKLTLVSREKDAAPIPGIEIWSRRIGMTKEDASEYIGKTDWQGSIVIPPDEGRLRLVYIKRGSRALKKLPIVPGLYRSVTSSVPNDTVRLFAQGVITGFQNDITSLVIQRRVFEEDIDSAIKKEDLDTAKQILRDYQELDTPQNIRSRMTDEQVRLESLTNDKREIDHIRKMFDNLNEVVSVEINKSRESELQARVQQLSGGR
jgi:hypothetical protein